MSAAAAGESRSSLTIGDVLAHLKVEFPDLTISKIRFLETEGLVQPERTPSGYRKFSGGDVARLRYVLSQQRDHYLPLRVIKEQLDAIDRGLVPPGAAGQPARRARGRRRDPGQRPDRGALPSGAGRDAAVEGGAAQRGRAALGPARASSSSSASSAPSPAGYYDDDALAVGKIVADLARFGLEGRHLRAFRTAAEREVGLFAQVVGPMGRQRGGEARARAEETVRELAALSVRLHAALVQIGLREVVGTS